MIEKKECVICGFDVIVLNCHYSCENCGCRDNDGLSLYPLGTKGCGDRVVGITSDGIEMVCECSCECHDEDFCVNDEGVLVWGIEMTKIKIICHKNNEKN